MNESGFLSFSVFLGIESNCSCIVCVHIIELFEWCYFVTLYGNKNLRQKLPVKNGRHECSRVIFFDDTGD